MKRISKTVHSTRSTALGGAPRVLAGALLALASLTAVAAPRFVEVAASAGVDFTHDNGMQGELWMVEVMGSGVGVLDFDGDGWLDLWLVQGGPLRERSGSLPGDRLFRNVSNGEALRFTDVTEDAGVVATGYGMGIATGDIDNDGDLDVFLANYGENQFYENLGDGRFKDITATVGFTGDDFYVANDLSENLLWLNQGDGRFVDDALFAGAAVNADGRAEASMGVTAADFDGDGDTDLFMTHLIKETNTLYINDGQGWFTDGSAITGIAFSSIPYTGFGTGWIDVDNDGDLDLFSANGEVSLIDAQRRAGDEHPLRQRNQLWLNDGKGNYEEAEGGPAFQLVDVSRGAAFGDLDNDGDIDIVVTNNNGAARIYRNDSEPAHWIGIEVRGDKRQPQPFGASVWRDANPGHGKRIGTDGSYASASDPRLLFGLGREAGTPNHLGALA